MKIKVTRSTQIMYTDNRTIELEIPDGTEDIIIRILKDLRDEGKTILVVHHDLKTAYEYFDKALLLNTSLVAYGKTDVALSTDNLARAYGQKGELFSEATRLSGAEKAGLTT